MAYYITGDWKVDYVFSHTCPLVYRPNRRNEECQEKIDLSTEEWMKLQRNQIIHNGIWDINMTMFNIQMLNYCMKKSKSQENQILFRKQEDQGTEQEKRCILLMEKRTQGKAMELLNGLMIMEHQGLYRLTFNIDCVFNWKYNMFNH